MKIKLLVALFSAIAIIAIFDNTKTTTKFDKQVIQRAESAISTLPSHLTTNAYQNGKVTFYSDNVEFTEEKLLEYVANYTKFDTDKTIGMLVWHDSMKHQAIASAPGLDWKHHFVNSYLVGIRPYPLENKWLALYTIAKMKSYQLDSEQYKTSDLWQNSAQAFMLPRGDCEDHAIILADWLISEGIDAKVAVGRYKTDGHAWVVAHIDGQDFILEATAKRVRKSWNHFPLAELATNYHATYMFNRQHFWVNTKGTKSYQTKDWLKTSRFETL